MSMARRAIGITGTNGAGKGVVVDYLIGKGFTHFSASGFLSEELLRRNLALDRNNLRMVGNEFRERFGSGFIVEHFLSEAQKKGIEQFVIESIRSTGEVAALKAAGGKLLVVDAERKLRYERIISRKSGKDHIDFDTFVAQEEREWYGAEGAHDMNIRLVMDQADHIILNNGTLEELYVQIDAFLPANES